MGEWISVKDRLPGNLKNVMVRCFYSEQHGTTRFFVGHYTRKFSEVSDPSDDDGLICDYLDETDEYYVPEGWYEQSLWHPDFCAMFVEYEVTHWQPLPEPPKEDLDTDTKETGE